MRAITGAGKGAHGLAEIAQAADEGLGRYLVELGHLLDVGAADHALLALAAQHTTRMLRIGGELCRPSRTASVTGEPRMFSEPALQIAT